MLKAWPAQIAIAALLLTIMPLSYPIYYLGKIPVCLAAIYYCVKNYNAHDQQVSEFWYFLAIAVLFNPVLPVHLFFSALWIIADIISAIYFYRYQKHLK